MVHAEAQQDEDLKARRTAAIWHLSEQLRGHELVAEMAQSEPVLVVLGDREQGTITLTIRCNPRKADGWALWFWLDTNGELAPLAPVDRLVDAVTAILGARIVRV
jgi:hypothetical protein